MLPTKRQNLTQVHVAETEQNVEITAKLPGVSKKDIKVRFTEDGLELSAQSRATFEKQTKQQYSYAETVSSFYRLVALPARVDAERAKAHFENGMLRIIAPKIDGADYIEIE